MADYKVILPGRPQRPIVSDSDTVSETKPVRVNKVKLSRTSTRKVRTGCITCKKRHIKCDESKPHCGNCLQARGHCEGYPPDHKKKKKKTPGPSELCWDSTQAIVPRTTSPTVQTKLNTNTMDFHNDTGMSYFQEFVGLVRGPWMRAASTGDLWEVMLPQLSRNNGTLRSAAMAIGALSVWHRQSAHASLRAVSAPDQPTAQEDAHYFQAVAHYCDSLKMQCRRASAQDAVFLSVLVLFFETLRGNRKAALDHVNHALSLLLAIVTDTDAHHRLADLAPNPRPVISAVADVFNHLAKQARTVFSGRISDGPPLPNLAKRLRSTKQTMETFMMLLSQTQSESAISPSSYPDAFDTLEEFEQVWPAMRRHQAAMGAIMEDVFKTCGLRSGDDAAMINKLHLEIFANPRIVDFCANFQKSMTKLNVAFQPLFNKIMQADLRSPTYLRAILLRIEFLGVYIFSNPPSFIDDQSARALTPLYREYLSLAHIALRAAKKEFQTNPAHHLSLQCSLSWFLLVTSLFCRDPLVRDEALWILKEYPGQDGIWSIRALYALARRNRYIERANAVEGTLEEQWQRLWRREFVFENSGDRIVLRYMEKDESARAWQLVEEAADLPKDSEDVQWKRQPLTMHSGLLVLDLFNAVTQGDMDTRIPIGRPC
ncbi:hypothetical protein CORC01_10743 [Colletotrichum orchidophilum]|uniref:Zn(2)-C6 fungal-type domain-containing protein n=1 Tax=Colletotrichum orchidophilum TaxID=1209926 RepID=A0A1G4AXV8_9PEZI|nr:uncharacterized protein CORC01_10743 [Colletotrichum orchidophilum]OHE93956.1 hypothetical protein CORC01_10743 [Colletotrichum orchidophilum]